MDRIISAYQYVLRTDSHPLNKVVVHDKIRSISGFIRHPDLRFHAENLQTRMLGAEYPYSGIVDNYENGRISAHQAAKQIRDFESQKCDYEKLDRAISRLESFDFVGFTENFNTSIRALFNARRKEVPATIPHEKRGRVPSWHLSTQDQTAIAEASFFDSKLYSFAFENYGHREN